MLSRELERFVPSNTMPVEALEQLVDWLEHDDDEAVVMFCDELTGLFRMDLDREQMRKRLVELLRHFIRALDRVA
jgi:hypothetical protein